MVHGKHFKLVLIDDDQNLLKLYERLFTRINPAIKVFTFNSPIEAFLSINEIKPQLVITDYGLPLINGVEVIKKITKLYPVKIPIILISGSMTQKIEDDAIEAGATIAISKLNAHVSIEKIIRSLNGI